MSLLNNKLTKNIWFLLPISLRSYISAKLRYRGYIPTGWVNFGDFRRMTPISSDYGQNRGLPIDRYFIERFMASHSSDIKGSVLEIGDDRYTTKYGKEKVTSSDILNLDAEENPKTTIEADLTYAPQVPSDTYECIIITQTLQLIYDLRAAIETLYRLLKPGGVVLITIPGISHTADIDHGPWCWEFTSISANKLFKEYFPPENLEVRSYGNILVAISFLYGVAAHELNEKELNYNDDNYECLLTVKAYKPK